MTARNESASAFGGLETTETLTTDQIEARARDLLARLTLDEKIWLMYGDTPFWPGLADMTGGGYGQQAWRPARCPVWVFPVFASPTDRAAR